MQKGSFTGDRWTRLKLLVNIMTHNTITHSNLSVSSAVVNPFFSTVRNRAGESFAACASAKQWPGDRRPLEQYQAPGDGKPREIRSTLVKGKVILTPKLMENSTSEKSMIQGIALSLRTGRNRN